MLMEEDAFTIIFALEKLGVMLYHDQSKVMSVMCHVLRNHVYFETSQVLGQK
jgi:hypothetical protein